MKARVISVAWLLPLLLTACFHRTQPPQKQAMAPPIVDTRPLGPEPPPLDLSQLAIVLPSPAITPGAGVQHKQPVKPTPHHRKPIKQNVEQASVEPTGVSAIGQLSPGDPTDLRQQTESSLASTERGLNGITRTLNDQELKTSAQIREFLKQARAALATSDVDGANTLALKAKVLLTELNP
jgi:hypothetical protein